VITFQEQRPLDIDHFLGPEGPVAYALPGFEARPQQVAMAHAVQRAFATNRHLAVEAGTGTGKSFAYLLGALDTIAAGRKVVVSTYTITLQQQLINKDIPFLAETLDIPFTATLAKGRNNYLCKRRLDYALRRGAQLFGDSMAELTRIAAWAAHTTDGSLSDIETVPSSDAWDLVMSEHGNCRGRKCPYFKDCFYWRARRQLKTADLIVTNHALLFSDLVLKETNAGLLPPYDRVIVDEAHTIERVAEEHFGINVSNFTFTRLLDRIYQPRRRKGLLAFLPNAREAIDRHKTLAQAVRVFFAQVQAWHEHAHAETNGRCHRAFVDDNITEPLRQLRLALSRLAKTQHDEDDRAEFTRYIDRCRSLELELADFLTQPRTDHVYWVEASSGRRRRVALRSAAVDVGPDVRRCLFDRFPSVVTTSATLSCGRDQQGFEFFASRVGLDDFDAVQLGSPFDYARQVTVYVESHLPAPTSDAFEPAAAAAIEKYLRISDGRAFVLFTSYRMLYRMAERLEPFLAEHHMPMLVQGTGLDRSVLLQRFKDETRSVLFGTDSFWQGVDVPGQALSNVIIVRLPFAVPNHPLIQGRIEHLRAQGINPFYAYQLPTAILKFKQGFGRLIRSKSDTGIIVVLDSRIVTRRYGRLFLDALPPCRVEIVGPQSNDD